MNEDEAPKHPLAGLGYEKGRTLYMQDWSTLVQPELDAGHKHIDRSVTYGSTALQAGYIINGGALGALPLYLGSMPGADKGNIALAAIPFIVGISFTAISSLASYLNFQWLSGIAFHDSNRNAAMLSRFYQGSSEKDPDPATRDKFSRWVRVSFYVGVGAGVSSLVSFICGGWLFIALAN